MMGGLRSEGIGGGGASDSSEIYRFLADKEFLESFKHEKIGAAVAEKRYHRILSRPEVWVYMGRERDYVLVPRLLCSCPDFMINVVARRRSKPCYHLVGLEKAVIQGSYMALDLSFEDALRIIYEVLDSGFSPTLRRLREDAGK